MARPLTPPLNGPAIRKRTFFFIAASLEELHEIYIPNTYPHQAWLKHNKLMDEM